MYVYSPGLRLSSLPSLPPPPHRAQGPVHSGLAHLLLDHSSFSVSPFHSEVVRGRLMRVLSFYHGMDVEVELKSTTMIQQGPLPAEASPQSCSCRFKRMLLISGKEQLSGKLRIRWDPPAVYTPMSGSSLCPLDLPTAWANKGTVTKLTVK